MKRPFLAAVFFVAIGAATALSQAGNRVISGVVTGAGGQPLADADVVLRENGHAGPLAETITDAQGRFNFTALPDGRFELIASHRGYANSAYEQHGAVSTAIVTGENLNTIGLVLSLAPLASISGVVTEDSGDPVPLAQLHLLREDPMRLNAKQRASSATADQLGNFEISQLTPGTYYLCATGVPWYRPNLLNSVPHLDQPRSPLDVAYAPSCYPDTSDFEAAEPITVNAGDHIVVNLMFHAVPAIRVSLQIPRPGPNRALLMPQLRQNFLGDKVFVQGGNFLADPNDPTGGSAITVTFSGVAPGQYEVELPEGGPNPGQARSGAIRVSSNDIAVDTSTLQSGASVSGKVMMEGSGKLPESLSISLIGDELDPVSSSQIQPDGTFHLDNTPPGNFEVLINGRNRSLDVSRLSINGAPSSSTKLHLGSDSIDVTVFATAPIASVTGSVVRNGKPASGVFVLLVPNDLHAAATAWIPNQSDSDGSFIWGRVPPGRYTAVAIDQGWKLDWRRTDVIAPYLPHGVALTITLDSHSATLTSPLEAQSPVAPPAQ